MALNVKQEELNMKTFNIFLWSYCYVGLGSYLLSKIYCSVLWLTAHPSSSVDVLGRLCFEMHSSLGNAIYIFFSLKKQVFVKTI